MTHASDQQRTVLVALDGSLAATTALPSVFALAAQLGADCRALHIVAEGGPGAELHRPWLETLATLSGISVWPDVIAPTVQLWQVFAAPANAFLKAFWHLEVRLDVGDAAAGILRASADPTVALVVLTTHGYRIESEQPLGSVAERVVAGAAQPILLIRPEVPPKLRLHGPALQRLLLPLDGTPTTARLLQPACMLASQLGAAIDILHVASAPHELPAEPGSLGAPQYVDQPQHEWPQWANEVMARLGVACAQCPRDVPIRIFLAHGEVGWEITRAATEQQSDAIVVARRSHLEPGRARVLRAILDRTPCPLLLVGED